MNDAMSAMALSSHGLLRRARSLQGKTAMLHTLASFPPYGCLFFEPKISEYVKANCRRQIISLAGFPDLFHQCRHGDAFMVSDLHSRTKIRPLMRRWSSSHL